MTQPVMVLDDFPALDVPVAPARPTRPARPANAATPARPADAAPADHDADEDEVLALTGHCRMSMHFQL
ncbi:hypothetical protein [Streptacidiphilus fuscans]|uniref:Uncharacterized protein n=1 Tax=Streptacidiphilus fuscans TaxID=2789292 RepID=A0A931FCW0_9ACTN|nr:hypothetical protein [Streptacidiphilus fuscans]MBF9068898.1 hypothetical protein [Streptacidiphilus fuscans]MBF9073352.1 hypothetical protein [Streptacidiphilus fuscans]